MARTRTPPVSIEIRSALARDALAAYTAWLAGSRDDVPVVLGKVASSLELLLETVQEAGL
jgi:hypothetical protein